MQLQDQVSTLKNQLDSKDKVINTLLEKCEKKHHEEIFPSQATGIGSSIVQTLSYLCKNSMIVSTWIKTPLIKSN